MSFVHLILAVSFAFSLPIKGEAAISGHTYSTGEGISVPADSIEDLVNGWLYQYLSVQNGHPYFEDQNWYKSTVTTKYESFDNVNVKYDIYQDALIIPVYKRDMTYAIILNPRAVISFTLDSRKFVNLNDLIPDCTGYYPGYFEMVYDGRLKFVIKWQKMIKDENEMSGGKFHIEKKYYLIRDNHLYHIKHNSSLVKLFPAHRQAIRKFVREKQIYFGRSGDVLLKDLVRYIDQFTE